VPPDVERLPLVLVPGIMASNLKYGSTSVWPVRSPLGIRALRRVQAPDLRATELLRHVRVLPLGPTNDLWGGFIDGVLQSETLGYVENESWFPFAYNWADDVRNSAVLLDRFVEDLAARLGDDVRFVVLAHSLGAMVARWYVDHLAGHRRVARMVLAGAADRGAPAAFLTLSQGELWPERLGRAGWDLQLFDFLVRLAIPDRLALLRAVPSLYQLLPDEAFVATQAGSLDVLTDARWLEDRTGVVPARHRDYLDDAHRMRAALSLPPRVPTTYVYATGESTPTDFFVPTDADGHTDWSALKTNWGIGDGFVLARAAAAADWGADVEVEWIAGLHSEFLNKPEFLAVLDRVTRAPLALPEAEAATTRADDLTRGVLDAIEFSARLRQAGLGSCAPVQLARSASRLQTEGADEEDAVRLGDLHPRDVLDPVASMQPGDVVVLMGQCAGVDLGAHLLWRLAWARRGAGSGPVPLRVEIVPGGDLIDAVATALGQLRWDDATRQTAERFVGDPDRVLLIEGWAEHVEAVADGLAAAPHLRAVLLDPQRRFTVDLEGIEWVEPPRVYGFPQYRRTLELYLGMSGRASEGGAVGVWVGLSPPGNRPLEALAPDALVRRSTVTVDWPLDLRTGLPRAAEFGFEVDADGIAGADWGGTLSPDDGVNRTVDVGLLSPEQLDAERVEARFFYRQRRLAVLDLDLRLWRAPASGASDWLPALWLDRVLHAAVDAGLAGAWGLSEGLAELPEAVRVQVDDPSEPSARERWRHVLLALNALPPGDDGRVPLSDWLATLVRLAGRGVQAEVFAEALEVVLGPGAQVAGVTDAHVESIADVPEAYVLGDDSVPFRFLERALTAGQAVARLSVPLFVDEQERVDEGAATGTGWLIADRVLVTNHHVVGARPGRPGFASGADLRRQVGATTARFHFEAHGEEGVDVVVERLLFSDPDLDVALIELRETPPGVEPLPLAAAALAWDPEVPTRVNIIQHPLGGPKRVALRDNLVLQPRATRELVYLTDTTIGSSGAPVLDDQWRVVGLHRAARRVAYEVAGRRVVQVNVGVQLEAVRRVLHASDPTLCRRVFGSRCSEPHGPG